MANAQLLKKLQLKVGQSLLILNAPEGYADMLVDSLPGVTCVTKSPKRCDGVFLFAQMRDELVTWFDTAVSTLIPDGLLWIAYPKKSGKLETDLTRDAGWETVFKSGWRGVRQISIDTTWSALRFALAESDAQMLDNQYVGKAHLRPLYDRLMEIMQSFGEDVTPGVRKTYVALKRKKQFAIIQASTKTRMDVGLKLKGTAVTTRLQEAGNFGSGSVTHKVALSSLADIDDELLHWLQMAYKQQN
jgi:predicted transport protein